MGPFGGNVFIFSRPLFRSLYVCMYVWLKQTNGYYADEHYLDNAGLLLEIVHVNWGGWRATIVTLRGENPEENPETEVEGGERRLLAGAKSIVGGG